MVSHKNERKSKIRIEFLRENPPSGKLARWAVLEEEKSVVDSFEASRLLNITRRHLYNLMKANKIRYKKKGGRYFFRVIDLDRWMVKTGRRQISFGTGEIWHSG